MVRYKRGSITIEFDVYYTHEKSSDLPEAVYVDEIYYYDGTEVKPHSDLFKYIEKNFEIDERDEDITNGV